MRLLHNIVNMNLLAILKSEEGDVPDYDLFEYNEKNNVKLREVCEDLKLKIIKFKFMKIKYKKDNIDQFYDYLHTYIIMNSMELIQKY